MSNKIKYGLSHVYYAKATIASNGSATYATPVAIPGAVSLSLDAQGDSTPFYADNIVYYTTIANNGYEGDLEVALLPETFYTDILGYRTDTAGIVYEDAGSSPVHFALMFQFEGDESAKRHILYNCTAARPSVSGSTKEASIEPQTETISITATTVYNASADKDIVKASATTTQSTAYNAWFSTAYQPVS